MAGKFELYRDKRGEYRYRLKAGNGEVVLASEGFKLRGRAKAAIASTIKNSQIPERYKRRESSTGKPFFTLHAGNHACLGQSEMYESEAARDNGIKSVMNAALNPSVDDQTE